MEKGPEEIELFDSLDSTLGFEYVEVLTSKFGPIRSIEEVSDTTNLVYSIETEEKKLILKILRPERKTGTDLDVEVTNAIGNKFLKKILLDEIIDGNHVLVTENIDGQLLKDVLYDKDVNFESVYSQIGDFFESVEKVKVINCGNVDNDFVGSSSDWSSFAREKLEYYKKSINGSLDDKYFDILTKNCSDISIDKPSLIPADINLSNFIIDKEKKLHVLDVGVYFSGDKFLPWGVLLGHTWNTDLSKIILEKHKGYEKSLHFYAAIEMIAIISYSLKFGIGEISSLRPFGNKLLAKDILLDNISLLDKQRAIDINQ